LCLQTIIFKMMEANELEYTRSKGTKSRGGPGESRAWNRTTVIIIHGVGKLFATFLENIMGNGAFAVSWQCLLRHLGAFLKRQSLEVCATVFQALRQILSKLEGINGIGKPSVYLIWHLWATGNPALVQTLDSADNNNLDALIAYIQSFNELYPLIEADLTIERVEVVLESLRLCLSSSVISTYSADVDILTPLQAQVLDCVQLVRTDIFGVPSILIRLLADIASKPYREGPPVPGVRQPSFVALSKAAMDVLQSYITRHKGDKDIFTSGALTRSIEALVVPIELKYKWPLEGKQPSTWRKATSTAVAILEETLPTLEQSPIDEQIIQEFGSSVIEITNGIAAADCSLAPPSADILADEEFDISAFTRLRNLITPSLGSPLISDRSRQTYTSSIFTNSIIHTPHRQDLPGPGQEPLDGLYATHMGRTYDPPPIRRSKMSYVLIDELFALVSVVHHDADQRSSERIKLAQAAAPFLILRAAIVLKAYIADQPLRGRMPQPMSQKRELIYILRKLVELDSEPR
ncbi:MAG: hypothetical protein M1830_006644, partial [Pleopsidium flavum]